MAAEGYEPSHAAIDQTEAGLYLEALEWLADATLLVHTTAEARVVPTAPHARDMWELGKLCSDRMALFQKVARSARAAAHPLSTRHLDESRQFLFGGATAESWHEVLLVEAVVGPYFRLFYESFLRATHPGLAGLAKELWADSQSFIRFGQARVARAMAAGESDQIQAALDKWLPLAIELLDEVPEHLDEGWGAAGHRDRSNALVRSDYLEEIATYLAATDLDTPDACLDTIPVAQLRWVGEDISPPARSPGPLTDATFAFSQTATGRATASVPPGHRSTPAAGE